MVVLSMVIDFTAQQNNKQMSPKSIAVPNT